MRRFLACCIFCAFAFAASAQTRDDSLYRALGERAGIARIVDALLDRVYADKRINDLFLRVDRADLARLIGEHVCRETGGPCEYTGRSMPEAHSGLAIKAKEFDAFVEDFTDAMEAVDVPYRTQNRVLKIFAPMRRDIIDQ
jgi:hemoglobin